MHYKFYKMKTNQQLLVLLTMGLFLGSCSTSQKHVAFNTGGWKEAIDPSSVRTHISEETNVVTEFQPKMNNALPVSSEVNKKIETSPAANFDKTKFFENLSKSAPGSILGRFGLEIRILREKLYRDISSNQYFVIV